ncbi:MAG TPA: hypothetical protein VFE47_30550 [Tepidisphaeraceae bacterium]|jgi:hypothetical protein|nr:hypothetical protein [Tepidisphaeraceae bacterium]
MLASLFSRKQEAYFPQTFYEVTLDMFAIVQYWQPSVEGVERGRMFERLLEAHCDARGISLTERPGSRTIRGRRAASKLMHENDAVIACGEVTIQLELKHLSADVSKNDLLIFNQKGLDYLVAADASFRKTPLYRVFLSGGILSPEARRFAMLWGILVIEPNRLPLMLLHYLSGRALNDLRHVPLAVQDEVWDEIPYLITPLQCRIHRAAALLRADEPMLTEGRMDRALDYLQRQVGDHYWSALDERDPHWLEQRFDAIVADTFLDRW